MKIIKLSSQAIGEAEASSCNLTKLIKVLMEFKEYLERFNWNEAEEIIKIIKQR